MLLPGNQKQLTESTRAIIAFIRIFCGHGGDLFTCMQHVYDGNISDINPMEKGNLRGRH